MPCNVITASRNIAPGFKPNNFSAIDIKNFLETDLNKNDYLNIYIGNLTPAYRSNDSAMKNAFKFPTVLMTLKYEGLSQVHKRPSY